MVTLVVIGSLSTVAYLAAATRARRWPLRRVGAFVSGVCLAVACFGPDPPSLAEHMAQHAVAVAVAAPLIVLGEPTLLLVRAAPRRWRRRLALRLGRLPDLPPAPVWIAFVGAQLAFHVTPLFDAALRIDWLHRLEHGVFLATAIAFWTPVLSRAPGIQRLRATEKAAYLVLALPAVDASALWLALRGHPAAAAAMAIAMMPIGGAAIAAVWSALEQEETQAVTLEMVNAP